jgi:hypothetical protein
MISLLFSTYSSEELVYIMYSFNFPHLFPSSLMCIIFV